MMKSSILKALLPLSLAACSAGGSAAIAPGSTSGSARTQIVTQPEVRPPAADFRKPLVYVSQQDHNSIGVFRLDGRRVGQITNKVKYPQGLFADASGTLYVANRGARDVLEFRRGAASPFKVLSDERKEPEGVTVCPDGTVYVANILGSHGGGGNVSVYAHGRTHPTGMLTYSSGFFFFLACDAQGNLFGSMVLGTTGTVIEFPGGQQSGAKQLPISWEEIRRASPSTTPATYSPPIRAKVSRSLPNPARRRGFKSRPSA